MLKKLSLAVVGIFFLKSACFGHIILETEHFALSIDSYLRQDCVSLKNTVDLDNSNSDDTTIYLGIDYSIGFRLESKTGGPQFYLKLERNGPGDYDAPLFVHNTLMTSGGAIEKYRNEELLPNIEEFWIDTPLLRNFRFKAGLYAYEVGHGFSLNGGYENYGFTLYKELENFTWRLYYCRPDVVYKNHLGPRVRQDEEQGYVYNHNAANFFATDVKFNIGNNSLQPYIGVLADYTSAGKRNNYFSAEINKDILGTLGLALCLKQDSLTFKSEAAHNFGQAESSDAAYKDVEHRGYLVYTDLKYNIGKFIPSLQFLVCSGNKVTPEIAREGAETLTSGKNRAFSSYSPLNKNLDDSIASSNSDMRPLVAMGGGYGLNYGVPRPRTFACTDFDNLLMPALGLDFNATEKLSFGLYGYYLRSFVRPVGTLGAEGKYLSQDLGYETDLFIDYQINKNILVSCLGGYFLPGRYYKELRDDTTGSLFSPFVRGDGNADSAYQMELAVELQF